MASAAMLRSAARSLRLLQPLEQQQQQRCLLARRLLSSSSVPTERRTCSPSSDKPSKGPMAKKGQVNEKTEDIYKQLLIKIDQVSDGLDEHSRLLKQLGLQIEENNRHRGTVDLTLWVVSISSSFLLFGLYKYIYIY